MSLAAWQDLKNQGVEIPEVVAYERWHTVGGLWNLNEKVGIDDDGEPVHHSMYNALWTNFMKEAIEFPDYPFEEHFGKPTCSFPPREALRDYLLGYTRKFKVDLGQVKTNHIVRSVRW